MALRAHRPHLLGVLERAVSGARGFFARVVLCRHCTRCFGQSMAVVGERWSDLQVRMYMRATVRVIIVECALSTDSSSIAGRC